MAAVEQRPQPTNLNARLTTFMFGSSVTSEKVFDLGSIPLVCRGGA